MPTYRLVVEYDGTDFHGFQFQPEHRTIAGALEGALGSLFGAEIGVAAAGRTDAGVHASGQVVSFKSEREFPVERLALAMNATLPADVTVREASLVDAGFSARFDATERVYEYLIWNRETPSALVRRWTHHVYRRIDDGIVENAARELVGEQDFVAFCGVLPEAGGTVRRVTSVQVERDGALLRLRIAGDGFLHHMVRIAVGTLVEIGTGRRGAGEIRRIIASRDRKRAGYTAPASGLFLAGVRYPGFDSYSRPELAYSGA